MSDLGRTSGPESATTDHNQEGNTSTSKKGNSPWNKGGARQQMSSALYSFEGAKAEIGAVLGRKHEKMKNKVMYDDFIEKWTNYLTSNMTGARDVVKTIIDRDDMDTRIDEDEPVDLTEEEATSTVKILLKTDEVKKFGSRREQAKDNLVKTEPTDGFINRVKHNTQILRLAGGERHLYQKDDGVTLSKGEIEIKIDEYLAMHVVRRSDQGRFGELQKSLLDGSHRGRDE